MPAVGQESGVLLDDRLVVSPGKDHHIIRFAFVNGFGRQYGNMQAGAEQVLLRRIIVHDVFDEVSQFKMIDQCCRGGGGAIAGNRSALMLQPP